MPNIALVSKSLLYVLLKLGNLLLGTFAGRYLVVDSTKRVTICNPAQHPIRAESG